MGKKKKKTLQSQRISKTIIIVPLSQAPPQNGGGALSEFLEYQHILSWKRAAQNFSKC